MSKYSISLHLSSKEKPTEYIPQSIFIMDIGSNLADPIFSKNQKHFEDFACTFLKKTRKLKLWAAKFALLK